MGENLYLCMNDFGYLLVLLLWSFFLMINEEVVVFGDIYYNIW